MKVKGIIITLLGLVITIHCINNYSDYICGIYTFECQLQQINNMFILFGFFIIVGGILQILSDFSDKQPNVRWYNLRQVTLDQIIVSVTVDGEELPGKYPYIIK